MMFIPFAAGLFALAHAGAFPEPTDAATNEFQAMAISPRPTGHFDLMKRLSPDYAVCGYLEGDPQYPLDCAEGGSPDAICGYNRALSWFGCCSSYTSARGTVTPLGCPRLTGCVPYSSVTTCSGSCASNTLLTSCTDSATPYCGTYAISLSQSYAGYFCDNSSLPVFTFLPTSIGTNGTATGLSGGSIRSGSATSTGQFVLTASTTTTSTSSSSSSSTSTSSTSLSLSSSSAMAVQTGAPGMLGLAGAAMVLLNAL